VAKRPDFPEHLGCIIETNYNNTLMQKQGYLGDKFEKAHNDKASFVFLIMNDSDMDKFANWWMSEANYGTSKFFVNLVFFGNKSRYLCRMTNDLVAKVNDGHWEVPLDLEVIR
jgi:hypothetical protein